MSVLPCFEGCGLWSRKFGEVNDFHYVQEDVYGLSNNWIGNLASQGKWIHNDFVHNACL